MSKKDEIPVVLVMPWTKPEPGVKHMLDAAPLPRPTGVDPGGKDSTVAVKSWYTADGELHFEPITAEHFYLEKKKNKFLILLARFMTFFRLNFLHRSRDNRAP